MSAGVLSVDMVVLDERWNTVPGLERIEALADAAVRALHAESEGNEVVVALSTDDEVHTLNRVHRGKDKPTNVLSFPAVADIGSSSIGDVILAYETCEEEADERGIPMADHACHLALHGILHLLGCDHEDPDDAATMESLETRLLGAIGIADPHVGELADEY